MNFFKTPTLLKRLYPNLLWDKKAHTSSHNSPQIYLTFDDGPVPEVTPWVWETLDQFEAKATFFCVGENVLRYPKLYQETIHRGHTVGNHTHRHFNGWKTNNSLYLQDVAQCSEVMKKYAPTVQYLTPLFRPPYGKITRRQIKQLKSDYTLVMWDILSGDFDARLSAEDCLRKSIRHTQPGTVIIFHDSYKAQKNLTYVLPRYLEHFARAGYQFRSL